MAQLRPPLATLDVPARRVGFAEFGCSGPVQTSPQPGRYMIGWPSGPTRERKRYGLGHSPGHMHAAQDGRSTNAEQRASGYKQSGKHKTPDDQGRRSSARLVGPMSPE